jgi:hypothetical protein
MEVEIRPVAYRIALSYRPVDVIGYAVNSETGVRYCVRRQEDDGLWTVDDWDTGMSISSRTGLHKTRRDAIKAAEKAIPHLLLGGVYKKAKNAAIKNLSRKSGFFGELSA